MPLMFVVIIVAQLLPLEGCNYYNGNSLRLLIALLTSVSKPFLPSVMKHPNLLVPFVRYKENEVLRIQSLVPILLLGPTSSIKEQMLPLLTLMSIVFLVPYA